MRQQSQKWTNTGIFNSKRHFADKNPNESSPVGTAVVDPTETEARDASVTTTEPEEDDVIPEPQPPKPTYQTKKPIELIAEVAPIEVDADFAYCDGLYFAPDMTKRNFDDKITHPKEGHPPEWIQLSTRKPYTPQTCKYCGLRFVMKWKPTHPFAKYYKGPEYVIPCGEDKPVKNESWLIAEGNTNNTNNNITN